MPVDKNCNLRYIKIFSCKALFSLGLSQRSLDAIAHRYALTCLDTPVCSESFLFFYTFICNNLHVLRPFPVSKSHIILAFLENASKIDGIQSMLSLKSETKPRPSANVRRFSNTVVEMASPPRVESETPPTVISGDGDSTSSSAITPAENALVVDSSCKSSSLSKNAKRKSKPVEQPSTTVKRLDDKPTPKHTPVSSSDPSPELTGSNTPEIDAVAQHQCDPSCTEDCPRNLTLRAVAIAAEIQSLQTCKLSRLKSLLSSDDPVGPYVLDLIFIKQKRCEHCRSKVSAEAICMWHALSCGYYPPLPKAEVESMLSIYDAVLACTTKACVIRAYIERLFKIPKQVRASLM